MRGEWKLDSSTKLTGVFGFPVGHSLSPVMHNAAFQQCQLNFAYAAFPISPERLEEAVRGISALSFRGVNVTIPHKVAVMDFLDEIDEEALEIGAVNTIVNANGKLIGYNTDGQGFIQSLLEEVDQPLAGLSVTILGAGGAARAVSVSLARSGVKSIRIANRSLGKAEELARHLSARVIASACTLDALIEQGLADTNLLINTTSVGMYPHVGEMPIPEKILHAGLIVSDLIYNPLKTKLLQTASEIGATVHTGLGMFVHQGALAFQLWTGRQAPIPLMKDIVLHQLTDNLRR
jgi:shikimate dehydrogenase